MLKPTSKTDSRLLARLWRAAKKSEVDAKAQHLCSFLDLALLLVIPAHMPYASPSRILHAIFASISLLSVRRNGSVHVLSGCRTVQTDAHGLLGFFRNIHPFLRTPQTIKMVSRKHGNS